MAILTEIEKAYMAGIIDGEGCISLSPAYKSKRGQVHRLLLTVNNTSLSLISWVAEKWQANLHLFKSNTLNSLLPLRKHKIYSCQINGKKAVLILKEILPYLICKKRQAEVAIEFGKTIGKTGQRVSDNIREKRMKLDKEIKIFNNNPI